MKPAREHATNNRQTYFVTSDTWERRALFRTETWARLFFKNLLHYRGESYLLHEFVLMPDHFHLLITPAGALERAIQLVKGGFSHRANQELGSNAEVWRRGFADHRIRDGEDYDRHRHYIHLNPVKKHLCLDWADYRYSSAYPGWKLDPIPQGLKPLVWTDADGTAEAVPFQSNGSSRHVCELLQARDVQSSPTDAAALSEEETGPGNREADRRAMLEIMEHREDYEIGVATLQASQGEAPIALEEAVRSIRKKEEL